jgi:mannosyltransferase OCH1-like enzyme
MKPSKAIARLLIKVIANLSKTACYGFHAIFPNKRFRLPSQSNPIIRLRNPHKIPHIIWQTNFTQQVTLPVYLNYLFNRLMSPSFEYRFMVTKEREMFIRTYYPDDILQAYKKLQIGASQADFWRLLVLQKQGGIYMDIDAHLVWPLGWILKKDLSAIYLRIKTGEISNYFIASAPNNPQITQMVELIHNNINENTLRNVYDLTGPGVFNQVLKGQEYATTYYRETCNQGNFTNEYFQYIDKPQGKWTKEQKKTELIKTDAIPPNIKDA